MSKQFIEGNVYVFTKKKFLKDVKKTQSKFNIKYWVIGWVNSINGNEVKIRSYINGSVGAMFVNPEWCKCIKNNNPKIESKVI